MPRPVKAVGRSTKRRDEISAAVNQPRLLPVFGFRDYRDFLQAIIRANDEQRGFRSRLAEAAGCTPSYLTQTLRRDASLSIDHLLKVSRFLQLPAAEWTYLRELAIMEKCGTVAARQDAEARAATMREAHGSGIFASSPAVPFDAGKLLGLMFSLTHWDVFFMLGAPGTGTPEGLAKRLGLAVRRVAGCLEDWRGIGLVDKGPTGEWRCGATRFTGISTVMSAVVAMYKMRVMHKSFSGETTQPLRWAALRIKQEDVEELGARFDELLRFAWKRANEREKDGDRVAFISLDLDVF